MADRVRDCVELAEDADGVTISLRYEGAPLGVAVHTAPRDTAVRQLMERSGGRVVAPARSLRFETGQREHAADLARAIRSRLLAISRRPISGRQVERILEITPQERRRWTQDGRLPPQDRARPRPGGGEVGQRTYAPGLIEPLACRPSAIDIWRAADAGQAGAAPPQVEIERFRRDGYAVVPVFRPQEVRAALADIADHLDRMAEALHAPFEQSRPHLPPTERLNAVAQTERAYANLLRMAVLTDAHRGPALSRLAQSPLLKAAAEQIAGRALGATTVRVRASLSAFPEHRHAWHSDVAIDDGSDCGRLTITAWIPLADVGPQSGGLEIATGRHAAPFAHVRASDFHIEDEAIAHLPRAQPACRAGEVLFLDRFTPHRTLPNPGPGRFALVVWMKAG